MKPYALFLVMLLGVRSAWTLALNDKPVLPPVDCTNCVNGVCAAPALMQTSLSDTGSTVPADLAAAWQAAEADRALIVTATAAVAKATADLKVANDLLATSTAQFSKDSALVRTLVNKYYPPDPSPIPDPVPPAPPLPPKPPVPQPDSVTLTMISNSGTSFQCPACEAVKAESVPTIRTQLGNAFTEVPYTDASVAKLFPQSESNFIPRFVLTRNGKTEKHTGYLSLQQLQGWISGSWSPPPKP